MAREPKAYESIMASASVYIHHTTPANPIHGEISTTLASRGFYKLQIYPFVLVSNDDAVNQLELFDHINRNSSYALFINGQSYGNISSVNLIVAHSWVDGSSSWVGVEDRLQFSDKSSNIVVELITSEKPEVKLAYDIDVNLAGVTAVDCLVYMSVRGALVITAH